MSHNLSIGNKTLPLDKDGYLRNLEDWDREVAHTLALQEGISLTKKHWEIIHLLRDFHHTHGLSPIMRVLVKLVKKEYGLEKGNSQYLLGLFPGNPATLASKIAGLPRPTNCL